MRILSKHECMSGLRVILASLIIIGGLFTYATEVFAHPSQAHDDQRNLEGGAKVSEIEAKRLKALHDEYKASPNSEAQAVAYARYASSLARRYGDTSFLRSAAESLSYWSDNAMPPVNVLVARAHINQIDHSFEDALLDLEKAISIQPNDSQALLSSAFILSTMGRPGEALEYCVKLRPNVSVLIREACRARASSLMGDAETSLKRLDSLLTAFRSKSVPATQLALSVAADIAMRLGRGEQSEAYLRQLVALDPNSVYARAAYAELLLDSGRLEEARELMKSAPNTDLVLSLRALSYGETQNEEAREAAETLIARMKDDLANGDYAHAREHARFALAYLKDQPLAHMLAKENWRTQKEPVDARILVEAALAVGDDAAISEVVEWRKKLGLEDRKLDALLNPQPSET